jgi:hypothetical protein
LLVGFAAISPFYLNRKPEQKIMRYISLSLTILLMAPRLQAQINWVADNRYVAITDTAQTVPEPGTNFLATQNPQAPFTSFTAALSGGADAYNPVPDVNGLNAIAHAGSYAAQNSFLAGNQVNLDLSVQAITGGNGSLSPESCFAEADSFFSVIFSVNDPQAWTLRLDSSFPNGNVSPGLDLVSSQNGSILGSPVSFGPTLYQGTLTPGDAYTLTVFLSATRNTPDPLASSSNASLNLEFTVVPEPGSGLLLGMGLISLLMLPGILSAKSRVAV